MSLKDRDERFGNILLVFSEAKDAVEKVSWVKSINQNSEYS